MLAAPILSAVMALPLLGSMTTLSMAAQQRGIEISKDGDYFGFDLRTEKNVSLDQCSSICLGDDACLAFTYNPKVQWCFLKSDFGQLNEAIGSIAGRVVAEAGVEVEADLGATPELPFPTHRLRAEAKEFKDGLPIDETGTGVHEWLTQIKKALKNADNRTAFEAYKSVARATPDDVHVFISLAETAMATAPTNDQERKSLQQAASSSGWLAYQLSRTSKTRANALALLGQALEQREDFQPALSAYKASLDLVSSRSVQALYDDLKLRRGFRILDKTVDNDAAIARLCVQFSENLVKKGFDYTPFVRLDNAAPSALDVNERQICVSGLEQGRNYALTLRQGLPAASGEILPATVNFSLYVQDRPASVRFTSDSFVLPSKARRGIPLVSVNLETANLKLFRVGERALTQLISGSNFLRQLDGYDVSNISEQMGAAVWEGAIEIAEQHLNREVTTSIPVDDIVPERKPGVYVLTAEPTDGKSTQDYSSRATQWFVISDIGLTTYTAQDGISIFTRSLSTAQPLEDVEITLLAKNNEVLGKVTSDDRGFAKIEPGLVRGNGGDAPAALLARVGDSDFLFLDLTRAGFDLSDRGVTGRAVPKQLDVFVWTERGIYRAGETVHVGALARDATSTAIDDLPLTFIFTRPDGVEDRRLISNSQKVGGYNIDLRLPKNAMRGTWTMAVYTDPKLPQIASQLFLVEDFVPDRIEFDLKNRSPEVTIGDSASVEVDGRFLYGAPAAGLQLEGDVLISTARTWDKFQGFYFGLADEEEGEKQRQPLTNLSALDGNGQALVNIDLTNVPSTTRLLNAEVSVRLLETGGRAVERKLDIALQPQADVIGIRPEFSGNSVEQGSIAKFRVIAADTEGARIDVQGATWSLVKIERNYQWYRSGNSWNYEPVTLTKEVSNGTMNIAAGEDVALSVPVDWGRYRLQIESGDVSGPISSVEFDAGWYVSSTSTETPDGLEIALDKARYTVGEKAKLRLSPRFAGSALVIIGGETLVRSFDVDVPEDGITIDIPVEDNWGAGQYVTATLFRPGEDVESRMPSRAIGLKWLAVTPGDKHLTVALNTPEMIAPRSRLAVPISVANANGQVAYVMVAAVDVGILNLTRYQPPDPVAWFFGQRQLGLEIRDIYGRLIDGSLGTTGKLRTGGDGGNMTADGSPPTEKLMALFSGPVRLDGDGQAIVEFDIPQFNGTARIMAVAWTKQAIGHANRDVVIRDPVVITASLPRFLTPGDVADIRLDFTPTEATTGAFELSIEPTAQVSLSAQSYPSNLELQSGKRTSVVLPLTAESIGTAGIKLRLIDAQGLSIEHDLVLPVLPVDQPVTTRKVIALEPGSAPLVLDQSLFGNSQIGGSNLSVSVSNHASFDVPGLLLGLDRYPYGCTEQTTSRALPLLYLAELSSMASGAISADEQEAVKTRVQDAIYQVLNNQSSSGAFGLWAPGSDDLWLDAYVSDFLTRARERGYIVPDQALISSLTNLQNALVYTNDVKDKGHEIAYALYVLARNKKASLGDLRYYADSQLADFASPMAVGQLAAGLALYGDQQRSEKLFSVALKRLQQAGSFDYSRSDYGSPLRDAAAVLSLAAEVKPVPQVLPALIDYVGQLRTKTKSLSTQDQAWMAMAARSVVKASDNLVLEVNGEGQQGAFSASIDGATLTNQPIEIANRSDASVEAALTIVAAPAQSLPAGGDGFAIERRYYTQEGEEINITSVAQNQRFVVVLKIEESAEWQSRVIVSDYLPAGFEIDNPSLVSSAELGNFSWLEKTEAAHLEFRDDRFVAAFNRSAGVKEPIILAYVIRAVTPGLYSHPPALVEDMYRPQFSARTATGMMEVTAP
jgi:uncharacterized protein YfaS (alpha-2-macroglobulin family)